MADPRKEVTTVTMNNQKTDVTVDTGNVDWVQPAPARPTLVRRQFLRLMGIVGAATVVTGCSALQRIGGALTGTSSVEESSPESLAQDSSLESPTPSDPVTSEASSPCVVRCPGGCSYPGRCGRYRDTNGNRRCDFGECM